MSGHTPGPWYLRRNRHADTDGREWGWLDTQPPGGAQRPPEGVRVEWTAGTTSYANARLIAAAPRMSDALWALLVAVGQLNLTPEQRAVAAAACDEASAALIESGRVLG